MSVIESKCYISVDVTANKNRWWKVELHDNDDVITRWGRVGSEDSKTFPSAGRSFMDKKIREKIRKGYTETRTVESGSTATVAPVQNTELHSIAKAQLVKSNNPVLDNLIQRFVRANVHKITENTTLTYNSSTGLFSTPLGIVTPDGVMEARTLLADIAKQVRKRQYDSDLMYTVGQYLRIVPQKVGRKLIVEDLFPDDNAVQKQNDILDSLESSYKALTMTTVDSGKTDHPEVFKVDLDVLSDRKERQRVIDYYEKSKKSMHSYDNIRVREVFQVNIHEMSNNFNRDLKPIKEVFHGTSQANCLSILKSGLKVSPPSTAAIAGKSFGNGIYGAINSTKSLGYTFGRWGQGRSADAGWLFVCDFAMGKIQDAKNSYSLQRGYDSLWAKAGDRFYNDELIVYKNNQVNIKYLLECK
jgi:poly [ADP-ribose] polymerase